MAHAGSKTEGWQRKMAQDYTPQEQAARATSDTGYGYYEFSGPGESWAGRGRRQRHAQRQRARGAGMGALGEEFANRSEYHMGTGEAARRMQGGVYNELGGMAQRFGDLGAQYQDMVSGRGPSQAQAQLQQATAANVANQQALAAAARGGGLAAQARQAQAQGAAANQAAAQQAAQIRAQEAQAGMQGMAGALQAQGQVIGQRGDLASQMRQQGQAAEMGYSDLALQHQLGHRQLDVGAIEGRRAFATNLVGSILGGGGGAASGIGAAVAASDERVKTNIAPGGQDATETVGALRPSKFEYEPGFGGPGERVGVMAQDLERTPGGRSLVQNTPHGKVVDVGGLASLGVAASAEQQKEIERQAKEIESLKDMQGGGRHAAASEPKWSRPVNDFDRYYRAGGSGRG